MHLRRHLPTGIALTAAAFLGGGAFAFTLNDSARFEGSQNNVAANAKSTPTSLCDIPGISNACDIKPETLPTTQAQPEPILTSLCDIPGISSVCPISVPSIQPSELSEPMPAVTRPAK